MDPRKPAITADVAAESAARPRLLCQAHALVASTTATTEGVLWRLDNTDRQVDVALVHLPAGASVHRHADPDRDLLLIVTSGSGVLATEDGCLPLAAGTMAWLPRGSARSVRAASAGLAYLTVCLRGDGSAAESGGGQS